LLIGGATTSRVHTAVKIHPNYRRGQTVYVTDASRAVGVAQSLMSEKTRAGYVDGVRQSLICSPYFCCSCFSRSVGSVFSS